MTDCIFCKIVHKEIPSKNIYEDEDDIAFLDINPASPGHALVAPKKHFENIFDIDSLSLRRTIEIVKLVAEKIKKEMQTRDINILLNTGYHAGQIVPHLHFHIIPRYPDDKIGFFFPRYQMDEQQFNEVHEKLRIN